MASPRLAVPLCLAFAACTTTPASPPPWASAAAGLGDAPLSIAGASPGDVWAVGADHGAGPLVLHHDGNSWSRVATGTRGTLWWVHAFADHSLLLAGAGATILRSDGKTFTRLATPGLANATVFGVWGASPTDAWAVGSVAGRNGFVWRWDGTAWTAVALPADLPLDGNHDLPGFFKVWGDGAGHVYVVGARGTVMRSTGGGPLTRLDSGTTETLFTVHGDASSVVVVGGSNNAVILEGKHDGALASVAPAGASLLQGVSVGQGGHAFASGASGAVWERTSPGAGWSRVSLGVTVSVESLHATWIDPDGGVWAVGGGVLSPALDNGAVIHRGADVGSYQPPAPPDGGTPAAICPDKKIDPAPNASIARRWDEQILGAIRIDIPRPPVHARNLFHLSAVMWDAWATYDKVASLYFIKERNTAVDVAAARKEAISYAAYRLLLHRYQSQIGGAVSAACFRAFMLKLALDPDDATATGDTPRAVGNRIAAAAIAATQEDGANETNNYADTTGWTPVNPPLVIDDVGTVLKDPSVWQQLNLAQAETQNGIVTMAGVQKYIGSNAGLVPPFGLVRPAPGQAYFDPLPRPTFDSPEMQQWVVDVIQKTAALDAADGVLIDTSPGAYGNNPLGTNDGTGTPTNPVTGQKYAAQSVPRGDFARVLAEFWADGPNSETPPGHWNVLANTVADAPGFTRQLGGAGPSLDPLEWDVKVYLALNGAVHDAGIASWEIKRKYLAIRPISLVRYMAGLGQSSDKTLPHYDPHGLPLVTGVIELVTAASSAAGQRHAHLARYVDEVAARSWRGEPGNRATEIGGVAWIRAREWLPYQRRTFVTPAFPGFTSGHSTFSRAAAEVLADLTGSPYFPGGLGEFVAKAGTYLTFEKGPSADVHLQWATYYDAADQAGQSRIYGGIHIQPDDFGGRRTGSAIGIAAARLARKFYDGTALR